MQLIKSRFLSPASIKFIATEAAAAPAPTTTTEMCFGFLCSEEEAVLATHKAPGSCPYCGGAVVATDVEGVRRLFFLPLCHKIKRKFSCTHCSRRLVTYS